MNGENLTVFVMAAIFGLAISGYATGYVTGYCHGHELAPASAQR